jgi:hypothetical protein
MRLFETRSRDAVVTVVLALLSAGPIEIIRVVAP